MPDDKHKRFTEMLNLLTEGITKADHTKFVEDMMKLTSAIEKSLVSKVDTKLSTVDGQVKEEIQKLRAIADEVKTSTESTFSVLKQRSMESISALFDKLRLTDKFDALMQEMMDEHKAKMAQMDSQIATIPTKEEFLALIPPPSPPETAIDERDRLESLQGDERLDKSAIKGLEEMDANITRLDRRVQTPAKAYKVHVADLTAQCNGVLTTFYVGGSHFGIIGVFGTEFPQIYRPVIDYTETATGFTLTSQVSPPATGQTLIAQFLK